MNFMVIDFGWLVYITTFAYNIKITKKVKKYMQIDVIKFAQNVLTFH